MKSTVIERAAEVLNSAGIEYWRAFHLVAGLAELGLLKNDVQYEMRQHLDKVLKEEGL